MKKNMVIGASGLVGAQLISALKESGHNPLATYLTHPIPSAIPLDIRQPSIVKNIFAEVKPDFVFLPAALPNVDYCETHSAECYETNVIGIQIVVNESNAVGAKIIYFSSDYIFDGLNGPYKETEPASPINEYGRQKTFAEHYVSLFAENYLIIRTTVVYGWEHQGKNFVFRLINSLKQGNKVKVPDDQIGTPTYAPELAQKTIALANIYTRGVVNITGKDCISRYEFAVNVAKVFNLPADLIVPVSTSELNQPAQRPLRAGLNTQKAEQLLRDTFLSSKDGLRLMLRDSNKLNVQI